MKKNISSINLYTIVVWGLTLLGFGLIVYRFIYGIGAVTNLSDDVPWGLWIGIDLLAGIAMAAGGFVVAGMIHLFGGHKMHALARPAILTALLGYLMFMVGLMVDLGRPWNMLQFILNGNHTSPLYEVGFCVMFYTTVLFLEFLPIAFDKFKMDRARTIWYEFSPWLIVVMMSVFMYGMTLKVSWSLIMAAILIFWEVCMRIGVMPRDKQMPILMIMAGVIFSSLHQSSLGAIYLMFPHDLHILWYSPILPILFLLSAVMVGPCMVIFEALTSEKLTGHAPKLELLITLSKVMPLLLIAYIALKFGDLLFRGVIVEVFSASNQAISWWFEMLLGSIIPLFLFLNPTYTKKKEGLLMASSLVVIGLIWNRVNVSIVGIQVGARWGTYIPSWAEAFITIGIFAGGLLVFAAISKNFPVAEESSVHS